MTVAGETRQARLAPLPRTPQPLFPARPRPRPPAPAVPLEDAEVSRWLPQRFKKVVTKLLDKGKIADPSGVFRFLFIDHTGYTMESLGGECPHPPHVAPHANTHVRAKGLQESTSSTRLPRLLPVCGDGTSQGGAPRRLPWAPASPSASTASLPSSPASRPAPL